MKERTPAVYILANYRRGTLYIGVTSNPIGRLYQHRTGETAGFTDRYAVKKLVHIEYFDDMESAIAREKQLKNWKRQWKIALIGSHNPDWRDLALEFGFEPISLLEPEDLDPGSSPG